MVLILVNLYNENTTHNAMVSGVETRTRTLSLRTALRH